MKDIHTHNEIFVREHICLSRLSNVLQIRTGIEGTCEICSPNNTSIIQPLLRVIEMVTFSKSGIIKATPAQVYNLLSDFERAPERSTFWKSVKLLKREGNCGTYETVAEFQHNQFSSVTQVTNQPEQRSDAEIVDGGGKGSRFCFTIASVPDGTQLTVQGEIVLPGFAQMLSGTAGKKLGEIVEGRIESVIANEELEKVRRALEH